MASSSPIQDGLAPDDPDRLLQDIMFGILLDWTCKSAGVKSPWASQESCLPISYQSPEAHRGQRRRIPAHRIHERRYEMIEKELQMAERKVLLKTVKSALRSCNLGTVDSSLSNALTSWQRSQEPQAPVIQPSNQSAADQSSPPSPRKRRRPLSLSTYLHARSLGRLNEHSCGVDGYGKKPY